jgi:hypothetical protein
MRRSIETQMDRDWGRFLKMGMGQTEFTAAVNLARQCGMRGGDGPAAHLDRRKRCPTFVSLQFVGRRLIRTGQKFRQAIMIFVAIVPLFAENRLR